MKYRNFLAITLTTAFIAGCGGGSSGSSPVTNTPVASTETFQFKTAYINNFNNSRSLPFTMTGVFSGVSVTGSGTFTQGGVSSATFENIAALKKTATISGTVTGTSNGKTETFPLSIILTSYLDTNYNPLGSDSPSYTVASSNINFPQTVKINDSGTLFSSTNYSSNSKLNVVGISIISFAVEPDTATTALLKLIQIDKNTSGSIVSSSSVSYRLTPSGGLTRLSENTLIGSDTLVITY